MAVSLLAARAAIHMAPHLTSRSCTTQAEMRAIAPVHTVQSSIKCLPLGACGYSFTNRAIPLSGAQITRLNARRRPLRVFAVAGGVRKARPSHGYDYYELLGVGPAADAGQVKQAYRWLQVSARRCGSFYTLFIGSSYHQNSHSALRSTSCHLASPFETFKCVRIVFLLFFWRWKG